MDWKMFIIRFVRNLIVFTLLSTLVLGGFGYLLAGQEGFLNLAAWGVALGLLGSVSSGFAMLLNAHIWTGYASRAGEWWFKKEAEGEDQKPNY
ncbi:MAG TPA: hypothetical protein VK900_15555 [Anaerolineales bacterium]|nr:hypothetical protein [Anaerolineales bacterium]